VRGFDLARPRLAVAVARAALVASVVLAALVPGHGPAGLWLVLLGCAIASRLVVANFQGNLFISGAFLSGALAAVLIGPAAALAVPAAAELVGWIVERYRRVMLLVNLAASVMPTVVAAALVHATHVDRDSAAFIALTAVASLAIIVTNIELVSFEIALVDGRNPNQGHGRLVDFLPPVAVNVAMVTSIAAVYTQSGIAVLSLVLVAVLAFTYMARLVIAARERTREYANLSWGVLSGLIRTLDARDHRAARHCAAVARFSRDIAARAGMSRRDQELAHTAGLLHDIGRFALSDRVMERGVVLTEDDWLAIRRHPELGADMLRDIGVYGPLAEIIVAHHERPDGKGYPIGLIDAQIPEIAKIIAVAEVYDTLTAPDTYRTRLSSFEALTELRRVAGKQLDSDYVEALAQVLAGQGTEYRHADAADYDEELAIERRMNEAAGG
jgi:putative nucleotidyltransferase with HDIG domain